MDPDFNTKDVQIIELHMMNKTIYYPLSLTTTFMIRSALYPVSLIRTRLQVQKGRDMYKGMTDAFRQIVRQEGFTGLYRGFLVNSLMVVSFFSYITVYENVRHYMAKHTRFTDKRLRAFVSGGCASMVGQTFLVPIDVVSQHLQMQGLVKKNLPGKNLDPIAISESSNKSRMGAAFNVVKNVYKKHGLRGFYRGYLISVVVYGGQSACWWTFYDMYCDLLGGCAPVWMPTLFVQGVAGPCAGVMTSILTNPLDIVRTRVQVQNTKASETAKQLWKEEGMSMFLKGVTARITQSVVFSFFMIVGYESVKRVSVLDEYKENIRW